MTTATVTRSAWRRRVPTIAVAVTVAIAAACSGDDDDEGAPTTVAPRSAAATSPSAGAGTDTFPITVEHAYGETVAPEEPTRVVTVGYNDQDPVLPLGVVPVGVMPWYQDHPIGSERTVEAYGGTEPEQVGGAEFLAIDFEQVAALDPDLIIGASAASAPSWLRSTGASSRCAARPRSGRSS